MHNLHARMMPKVGKGFAQSEDVALRGLEIEVWAKKKNRRHSHPAVQT